MTLGWTEDGPEAEALLSYSQSGDPNIHFDDKTQLYGEKRRLSEYTPVDIEENAVSTRIINSSNEKALAGFSLTEVAKNFQSGAFDRSSRIKREAIT